MSLLAHDAPGRLRFVVPYLKRNYPGSEEARARARAISGVTGASASTLTGSLVVTYDGGAATRERIIQAVDRLALASTAPVAAHADPQGARTVPRGQAIGTMVVNALAEALVEARSGRRSPRWSDPHAAGATSGAIVIVLSPN